MRNQALTAQAVPSQPRHLACPFVWYTFKSAIARDDFAAACCLVGHVAIFLFLDCLPLPLVRLTGVRGAKDTLHTRLVFFVSLSFLQIDRAFVWEN